RAHSIGESLGEHGDGAIGKIDRRATKTRFVVESSGGAHVMRDVRDVHLQVPAGKAARLCGQAFDIHGVVKVARGFSVDGDDGQAAEVFAAGAVDFADGHRAALCLLRDFGGEVMRKMVLANDDLGVHAEIAGASENFDDATGGRGAAARKPGKLNVDDGA